MPTIVVGTAGHIDHGKSALVKALTGTDPDRLKEEQERGITIDLGFAHTTIGDTVVSFVDVPGHEKFVRNMLAGAGGFDAVMLVIAANESVMPQTREHFEICRLLGIPRGVIALTKSDLVDGGTIDLATLEIRDLVHGTFLETAPIVAVSSVTGEGLDRLRSALVSLAKSTDARGRDDVPRLPVDRVFLLKGFGTVITGTLVSGRVAVQDELIALPDEGVVRVRGLQVHGEAKTEATAPRRVALNIGSIDGAELRRGVTLTRAGLLKPTRRMDAQLELIRDTKPLRHGARVRVHQGTSEILGRVSLPAAPIPPGGQAFVRFRLDQPAVLTRGDRFVIRAYSPPHTIGGGVVLDPEPPAAGIRRAGALAWFEELVSDAFSVLFLREARVRGLAAIDLVRRGGLGFAGAQAVLDSLVARRAAVAVNRRWYDAGIVATLTSAIEEHTRAFHRAHPHEPGMPRESLREQSAAEAPVDLFDFVLENLQRGGALTGVDRISHRDYRPAASVGEITARDVIETSLRTAGLTPPDPATLAGAANVTVAVFERLLQELVRDRRLVRLGALMFHIDVLARLKDDVKALKVLGNGSATVDVGTFKERYGLTRKYAIPLLEWLDRERVTRRVGEKRIVI